MKKGFALALCTVMVLALLIPTLGFAQRAYDNGTYRGTFQDGGVQQVSIQFNLEDGLFKNLSFRHLYYKDVDYRKIDENHPQYPVVQQHNQILEYLEGKPVSAMFDLHSLEGLVDDVDTYTAATIRGSKVISAIQDGLNRGVYVPAGEYNKELGQFEDGRYRGLFSDGGDQQVSIQFHLENNILKDLSFRHLYYKGIDYRTIDENHEYWPVKLQHDQILAHLDGKPIQAIFDLHDTSFIDDVDGFTGASIRGNKVLSAIVDGLNRGTYTPAGEPDRSIGQYEDGRYRGIFGDRGAMQVSIQFSLENNVIKDLSFRHLFHGGNDYRKMAEGDLLWPVVVQHQQILDYLEGKTLDTIFDLHTPGEFIDDIDTFTGATIRANKVLSAMRDGLNRGVYTPVASTTPQPEPVPQPEPTPQPELTEGELPNTGQLPLIFFMVIGLAAIVTGVVLLKKAKA